MKPSFRQIEIFHTVMIAGSAVAAARLLHTSQPTVSREIKELERRLDFQLFMRRGSSLFPTEQAFALLDTVDRYFQGMDTILQAAHAIKKNRKRRVEISCLPTHADTILPRVSKDLIQMSEPIGLAIRSIENNLFQSPALSKRSDIILVETSFEDERFETEILSVGDLVCILPEDHQLCDHKIINLDQLNGEDMVRFNTNDPYRKMLDDLFDEHQLDCRTMVEATTASSICSMVQQGVGLSIVNPITAYLGPHKSYQIRPLSVSIPYTVCLLKLIETDQKEMVSIVAQSIRDCISDFNKRYA